MALKPFEELSRSQQYQRKRKGIVSDGRGRHHNGPKGPEHPRWSDERHLSSDGYVLVRVGKTHPLADANGYAYEHILVASTALGRPLRADEVVHHKNEFQTDNRWENLEVKTRPQHGALHSAAMVRDQMTGQFVRKNGGLTPTSGGHLLDGREYHQFPEVRR